MNIVILGSSGYLGSTTYNKLKMDKNLTVIGTRNHLSNRDDLVALDVLNNKTVAEFFKIHNVDVVIWCIMDRLNEKTVLENGLKNVIDNLNGQKLIFVSTDAFAEGKGNYDENTVMQYYSDLNPLSSYANSKIDAEKLIEEKLSNYVIVRTGPIYGKDSFGNWSDQRAVNLRCKFENGEEIRFHENMYKTFVHVEDLACSLLELSKLDYKGIIHIGPSTKESYYRFNKKIAEEMGFDSSLIQKSIMSEKESNEQGIPLDTSMNTEKVKSILSTKFRNLYDKRLENHLKPD